MGRVGRGLWAPIPRGELCWGRLWGASRAFSVSSPESVTADGQSTGKSDGKPDAARAAARSSSALPTRPRRLAGLSGCNPGAASPQGEPAVEKATRVRAPEGWGRRPLPPSIGQLKSPRCGHAGVWGRAAGYPVPPLHPPTLLEVKLKLPRGRVSWT